MLNTFPPSIRRLINELSKLPSVGEKSATRLAYHLIAKTEQEALQLAEAIREAKLRITLCPACFSLAEDGKPCSICASDGRDRSVICVVEKPADVMAVERGGSYRGLYHVLHGLWSPVRGVGPERTRIPELVSRLEREATAVKELVLATSTTVEGDATALYIANSVEHLGLRISRIAQGIPKGGELEYADDLTLSHAFQGRRSL